MINKKKTNWKLGWCIKLTITIATTHQSLIFLDSIKLKTLWKKKTFFKPRVSIILWCTFKTCNNWNPFHNDIMLLKSASIKFSSNQNQLKDTSDVHYFKLPYIGNLSHHIKNKLSKLCKEFCKENVNIKLVLTSFKIEN